VKQNEINAHLKASKSRTIKLYRGMASDVLNLHPRSYLSEQKKFLHWILALRSSGKMHYPDFLDVQIQAFEKLLRTERQHFTDDREIARSYAKKNKGILFGKANLIIWGAPPKKYFIAASMITMFVMIQFDNLKFRDLAPKPQIKTE
jgi:hypothetical protein